VVDTGVVNHPDLAPKLIGGFDFVSTTNEDGDGIDADPTDPGCVIGGGSVFHGTHVAGTIGARSNDSPAVTGAGVAGVSWGARIMPIRALDGCAGTGSSFDIIQGIRYAAGLSNDSGTVPAQRAAVINLSFGSQGSCDPTVVDLFEAVRQQGVVVVVSAGNDNTSAAFTPASCPNVINVAAVGPQREKAPYSNFGATIDLAAPGGDMRRDINGDGQPDGIYSTHANGGGVLVAPTLDLLQGTSMAAPHVAGVIALMLSANPAVTPAQIDTLIAQGSITDGLPASAGLGNGLINAQKAVLAVDPNAPPLPPTLSVTPSSLAFGNIGTVAQLFVSNAGGGTLTVSSVTETQPWLTVTATSVDGGGLGEYTATVDRAGLAPGTYNGTIVFSSDGGTVNVSVLMDVGAATGGPSAGRQYILLTDPVTGATLDQIDVLAEGTSVPYLFPGVPPGEYILISGTDLNNDQFICDPAEACGAYPVESAPVPIVVGEDGLAGLDFVVSYRSGTPSTTNARSSGATKVRRFPSQPPGK
jgi:serine protease